MHLEKRSDIRRGGIVPRVGLLHPVDIGSASGTGGAATAFGREGVAV